MCGGERRNFLGIQINHSLWENWWKDKALFKRTEMDELGLQATYQSELIQSMSS